MTTNKCVVGSPSEKSLEKDSLKSTSVAHAPGPSSDDSPSRSSRDDPFVVKGGMKLSATAPVFMPTRNGNIMMSIKEPAKLPFAHLPLSSQQAQPDLATMLLQRIVEADDAPANNDNATNTCLFASDVFSWRNDTSRCMEVSCDLPGIVVKSAVVQTLTFVGEAYRLKGDSDYEAKGHVMYLRFDDIMDSETIYNALKKDQPDLSVNFVNPNVYGALCIPPRKFPAQEGAVFVSIAYPSTELKLKEEFERNVRGVLGQVGRIHAWKLCTIDNATLCQMLVEYANSCHANMAVQRLCGKETSIAPYFPKMHVELETEARQRSGKSSAVVPLTRTNSLNNPSDEAFVEHLRMLATNQTPPTIKHGHPTSTYGLQRSSGYSFHTGFPPPTPAGSTFPMYQARNSDPRTPMNRGNMLGSSSYQHVATPYSDGCKQNFSPPGMGMGMGRRLFQNPSTPSFGSPHRRSYDFDTPMYATPRKPGLLSPFRGFMSPSMTIHNSVEPDKIVAGEDVRTTVMLRNIPNKVTQQELKSFLDTTSFGKYDFAYLRIDFSNNCNVGYAFINFGDPMDIITFFNARAGKRFNVGVVTTDQCRWRDLAKSDKISEISYATIQGRDCLIQKFRNSSVMAEAEHCRPKLFYTDDDMMGRAGQEEPFPAADNMAKLKRSCENAEHIGLYAPNAGIHYRDEQRRRRSLFDRGTSMAESEGRNYYDHRSPPNRPYGSMGPPLRATIGTPTEDDGQFGGFF